MVIRALLSALAVGAAALPFPAAAAAAARIETAIPARFQGEWRDDLENCGAAGDLSRLMITARTLQFWETESSIVTVATRGETDLAIIAEASGEGFDWLATYRFILSDDGARLTDPSADDYLRYRCPDRRP